MGDTVVARNAACEPYFENYFLRKVTLTGSSMSRIILASRTEDYATFVFPINFKITIESKKMFCLWAHISISLWWLCLKQSQEFKSFI